MSCTAGVKPACTLVVAYGASIEWNILRLARLGMRLRDFVTPMYVARSLAFHSHSRLRRKSNGAGNASVLIDVSTWKIFGPWSRRTLPIRQMLLCSALWSRWPIKLRVFWSDSGLWWKLRQRYDASPVMTDFQPPSIATWLTLAYTIRSESAARLLISTISPSSVVPSTARLS